MSRLRNIVPSYRWRGDANSSVNCMRDYHHLCKARRRDLRAGAGHYLKCECPCHTLKKHDG